MEVKEYQEIIEKTAVFPKEISLLYCALGICGESGEVAEKVKKLYRDRPHLIDDVKKNYKTVISLDALQLREDLVRELGDVLWYITALANELGVPLEEVMQKNYDKLIARRQTGTLHGSGDDREIVEVIINNCEEERPKGMFSKYVKTAKEMDDFHSGTKHFQS